MSHEPRVMTSQAVPAPRGYSPTGSEKGGKTKMAITRSPDRLWHNQWFTRTQAPSEAKGDWARGRSEGKSTVYVQMVHPGATAWDRETYNVPQAVTEVCCLELKWKPWAYGQRVSVRIPGKAAQSCYGLMQSQEKRKNTMSSNVLDFLQRKM